MRIAPALIALSLCAIPASAQQTAPAASKCQTRPDVHQANRNAQAGPRRLDQLPPGNLEHAVWREVDRCQVPAIVRYNVEARHR
jgi:hypothetical protein